MEAPLDLKLVEHICRIIFTEVSRCLHVCRHARIILLYSSLFISSERVASEIRVVGIQLRFYLFRHFRRRLNGWSALLPKRICQTLHTSTRPHINSKGRPYLSTVSTNTLNASTCTQIMAPSLYPVRPNLSASPQTFLSSLLRSSTSLFSCSPPPSTYLKSRGVHRFSRTLWINSAECFLNIVTAKRVNSSSLASSCDERGTTKGARVSYDLRYSLVCEFGTAIRCVSRYSESRTRAEGGTIEVNEREARLPVCRRSAPARLVLTELYWLNLDLTSLSRACSSFARKSMRSAMDLSTRYLILFHWKVRRYWSTGSAGPKLD